MNVVTPPNIVPGSGRPPEDDFDGLLRAYFRAEMPDPWPSFKVPASRNRVVPSRETTPWQTTLWSSRLALAAAILLLIAGALFVFGDNSGSGAAKPAKPDDIGITAGRPKLEDDGPSLLFNNEGTIGIQQNVPLRKK